MRHLHLTARFWDVVVRTGAVFAIIVVTQICPAFVTPGHAQLSIWDQLQGSTYGSDQAPPPKKAPLDDLRPDSTPWRSDVMLNALSAAIERYQKIVDSGGWPTVPPGRMMRAGDDDPRVPILRKRL